ncbi:Cadherin domain [Nesidiocoris tenuis]|uniref:Cadherin-related family member 1 n=1 Tax=Nesidiocoris tenuis TaxID=355587 RepID=A0ABN7AIG6_9HEMI|nr:Cadherin domain [Nesidiocoris tenuis]
MARTRQRNEALSPPPDWKWRFSVRQLLLLISLISAAAAAVDRPNHPPRFLIEGDKTEIVLRLKEGPDTPAGSTIYRLRGFDIDGDNLSFGKLSSDGTDVVKIVNLNHNEANVILAKELDREERDEYMVVLTLTDGRLGDGNFITQSLLILVEDVNDNEPVFKPYRSTITVAEDSGPGILTTLEATDADEGPYGQVKYTLADQDNEENLFTVTTANGKGLIKLIGQLDYEKKFLYHLKVLATDRSNGQRVNTATAGLIIKVDDVEDMPPEFVVVSPVARLSEDARIGTSVLQVKAVDGDRGVNNPIKYSIVSGSDGVFDIEPNTGKVFTLKKIDREAIINVNSGAYILEIEAREETSKVYPTPTARTEVTVIVTDVNDEAPTFRSPRYTCRVNENAQVSTPVTFLPPAEPQVYDYDQGNNGTFEMFLEGDDGLFDVTPRQGINDASFLIRVKDSSRLDYEKMTVINFTLVAKEMVLYRPKSSTVPVTVYVLDMNDNFPEFSKPLYEVSVPENSGPGTTVAIVYARDKDSGKFGSEGIRYTGLGGSIADLLALDSISGAITIKSEKPIFDRELIAKHYLTVEARDDLGMGNRNTVQLVINVDDVNDNAPQFIQSTYEARLLENEANFESPVFIEARDADLNGTKNSEVRYTLIGYSQYKRNFTLDPVTGELKPMKPIDFEALIMPDTKNILGSYPVTLQVKAEDGGKPSLSSVTTVTVYVQDVNDFAPVFEVANFSTTIPEDVPGGTSIVKLIAHDADGSAPNNVIAYRIVDGAGDKFVMNSITGVISTALGSSLDPDLTQPRILRYQLNVIALDGGIGRQQMSATASVTVIVRDVNNKPPVLQDPGTVRIRENTPVGHIVTRLVAHDPDTTAKLRYTIDHSGTEGRNEEGRIVRNSEINLEACLELDQNDGTLRVARLIDREEVETIKLIINVEDLEAQKGKQTVSAVLNVVIEDENDNNPEFRKPFYKRSVTENSQNGITIANIVADDADKNRTITYSLQGGKSLKDLVHLDSATGELLVASRIDREQVPWINMTVKATDSGIPPRSAFVDVFIQVLDENDNNPYFLSDISNISIYENTTIGTEIARIEADDADAGDYGKITYLLDRRSSQGKFQINPETGVLNVTDQLNREETSSYLLIVQAWDNYQFGYASGESRNAFKQLSVIILDVNDEAPQFTHLPESCVAITEFHEPRDTIILLKATDADDPKTPNGQLIFSILAGNEKRLFELDPVDPWSSKVLSTGSLKGRYGNYSLTIQAVDQGKPPKSAIANLDICITDFNDNAPVFISPSQNATIRIPENATVGSEIIRVEAIDKDIGQNAFVSYRLKQDLSGDWKTFEIDSNTGLLSLKNPLDRETQKIYQIRVEAYDHGTPTPLSSDLDLTIYVRNVNDYEPQFLVEEFAVNFTENMRPGVERRQIIDTVDRDDVDYLDEPAPPVCYYIIAGNDDNNFEIEPISHQITTIRELDREEKEIHTLLVKASEDCTKAPPKFSNATLSENAVRDDTILKLLIWVVDTNDNAPHFVKRVFTGGVSTEAEFGTEALQVKAEDPDVSVNAELSYYIDGEIRTTLSEEMDNVQVPPFVIDKSTGSVFLNFDPQKGMKGYFDFTVYVNDTGGLADSAHVFIYLLREDQRVRFVLRQHPPELRGKTDRFREVLSNVTGSIANVDLFRVHESRDGRVDKTKTDLYMHFVDPKDHSVLEVQQVLSDIDHKIEHLDSIFKEFNVLDTQAGEAITLARVAQPDGVLILWLLGATAFLTILLIVVISLCMSQRSSYQRQIKAATVTAFGSTESDVARAPGRVPNTNMHSVEGSNPIWMQAYENEWYKDDEISHNNSERDSLDENAVASTGGHEDSNGNSSCNSLQSLEPGQSNMIKNEAPVPLTVKEQNDLNRNGNTYHRNLYQHMDKLGNPLISKKLETTEL